MIRNKRNEPVAAVVIVTAAAVIPFLKTLTFGSTKIRASSDPYSGTILL
jgi:hypothetical protein